LTFPIKQKTKELLRVSQPHDGRIEVSVGEPFANTGFSIGTFDYRRTEAGTISGILTDSE
jgi:hypothetical protein